MGIPCTCVRSAFCRRGSVFHILGISLSVLLLFTFRVAERGYYDSQPIEDVAILWVCVRYQDYGYRR